MNELEQHLRWVRSREDAVTRSLRKLLEAAGAEVPEDRLMEFGERFYHHIRVIGGGYLDQNFVAMTFTPDDKIVEAFDAALKTMGIQRVAKKDEL